MARSRGGENAKVNEDLQDGRRMGKFAELPGLST